MKRIYILATGGTIAGAADSQVSTTKYKSGAIDIKQVVSRVPELNDLAEISCEDFLAVGSEDMTCELWVQIATRVQTLVDNENVDGIVITHGTDTMEELAYFLNLVLKTHKSVVLVGSMRPATALGYEGTINLYNGVLTGIAPEATGQGVLVVINDTIFAARDVEKQDGFRTNAFGGVLADLGVICGGQVSFARQSLKAHTMATDFSLSNFTGNALPKVEIFYMSVGCDSKILQHMAATGTQGIVIAAYGNGTVSQEISNVLGDLSKQGMPVVISSRVANAMINQADEGLVAGGNLSPQKARILLMLALARGSSSSEIAGYFQKY